MGLLQRIGLAPIPDAVVLDEMTLAPVAELDVGGWRGHIAADDGAVWISTYGKRALTRIDAATRAEALRVKLPKKPRWVSVDRGAGPVVLCEDDVIVRVDSAAGEVAARADLPEGTVDVAAREGAVWVLRAAGGFPFEISLIQLDPASLAPQREVALGQSNLWGPLRAGDGALTAIVEDPPGSMAERVFDLATGAELPADRAPKTKGIAERDGLRWLRDGDRGFKLVEIASERVVAQGEAPGPSASSAIVAHGCLWACNYREPRPGQSSYMD